MSTDQAPPDVLADLASPALLGADLASPALLRADDEAWDAFVAASPAGSHLQLAAWARAKARGGWRSFRVVVDAGSGPIGAQVLVRRLGPGPFAIGYAPRGPIATTVDAASLAAFGGALRDEARRHRLTHVTLEPGLEDGPVRALLAAAGWRPSDPVQHDRSRLVDLTQTEEALWGDLRQTSRRSVGRARREGCRVREGGPQDLPAFHAILVETARRSGFIHRTLEAYRDVYEAFAPSGSARLLFCDLADGTPAATKLLLRCGGRVGQPYSGMTAAGAESRASYLLEWETIVRSRADGATVYDMWGRSTAGISYFKAGFGGREVDYCGAWDLVTIPLVRAAVVRAHRAWVSVARQRHHLPAGAGSSEESEGSEPGTAAAGEPGTAAKGEP